MFKTYRYYYEYGNEDDKIKCTEKEWKSIDSAINYAHRYAKGLRFLNVIIEDEDEKVIYTLNSDGIIEDNRK